MNEMFCFQCQQTAHNTGCEGKVGVCGKKSDTANYQDELVGALIGLARACKDGNPTKDTTKLITKGLFTTLTNVNFNDQTIKQMIEEVHQEKLKVNSNKFEDYDVKNIWNANEDVRSLKSLILFGIKGMSAYAYHSEILGKSNSEVDDFFYEALYSLGEDYDADTLLNLVLKTGEVNYKCLQLLDEANTEAYGNPVPTEVSLTIEKGPFIVVSGHDLHEQRHK